MYSYHGTLVFFSLYVCVIGFLTISKISRLQFFHLCTHKTTEFFNHHAVVAKYLSKYLTSQSKKGKEYVRYRRYKGTTDSRCVVLPGRCVCIVICEHFFFNHLPKYRLTRIIDVAELAFSNNRVPTQLGFYI